MIHCWQSCLCLLIISSFTQIVDGYHDRYAELQEKILPTGAIVFDLTIFLFCVLIFTYPPEALINTGLTLENLTSGYLGQSDPDVVQYHSRRIVVNRSFAIALPFFFSLVLFLLHENAIIFSLHPTRLIQYFANVSVLFLLCAAVYFLFHHSTDYTTLRPVSSLRRHGEIRQIFTQIATECLEPDTFHHNLTSTSKIIVTGRWFIYSSKFNFTVLKLDEVSFHIVDAINNALLPSGLGDGAVQLFTVKVEVPRELGNDVMFKIHNLTLRDLQSKLTRRIHIADHVKMQFSVTEQFIKALEGEALKNPRYTPNADRELDYCLGCSEVLANVKIDKHCSSEFNTAGLPNCRQCFCAPMWCIGCMGRIFASKQDQDHSQTWLDGKAPCPTCRATFCVLDVCLLEGYDANADGGSNQENNS